MHEARFDSQDTHLEDYLGGTGETPDVEPEDRKAHVILVKRRLLHGVKLLAFVNVFPAGSAPNTPQQQHPPSQRRARWTVRQRCANEGNKSDLKQRAPRVW
jgi:hypothetical protein